MIQLWIIFCILCAIHKYSHSFPNIIYNLSCFISTYIRIIKKDYICVAVVAKLMFRILILYNSNFIYADMQIPKFMTPVLTAACAPLAYYSNVKLKFSIDLVLLCLYRIKDWWFLVYIQTKHYHLLLLYNGIELVRILFYIYFV